ncbi:MAG: tRNA pseudouridine(13) synthase TruD [Phycisphaerales bacterium]|jgi:tRNA pseudouridine13 synthase|nr:tRNA pseudouridine(13) synthase TruD [Phycisphaerales bacterium]MBT7171626.1 tRNA pseudouridine(13) synthase TruD [Phycisphaerales bacterium]
MTTERPYLTAALPGVGGVCKERPSDFQVEELPLYPCCGHGSHVYFEVVKQGVSTHVAAERIAQHMGVRVHDIGYAGLKDAHALTRQWMSLEHADAAKLLGYHDKQVVVTQTALHTNKLKTGHLRANRFVLRLRRVCGGAVKKAEAILSVLAERGVPNYYGSQRFGMRGDTAELGRLLLRHDKMGFLRAFLGSPMECDAPPIASARAAFDAGEYDRALRCWPKHAHEQRKALCGFRRRDKAGEGIGAVSKKLLRLMTSAAQSEVFNAVLAERLETMGTLRAGDWAQKVESGGLFYVEDPAAEQPRCDAWDISPTGPIPGSRMLQAGGEVLEIEQRAVAIHGMTLADFDRAGSIKLDGARRALRFRLEEPGLSAGRDEHGDYLEIKFTAPSGSYATVALDEIMKL